ncbi:MAG: site-specific integrase [bacterium]|nr:site-specific integrase [bacterium]
MANSTPARKRAKAQRDCPLYLHKSGQWTKKILARTVYFGSDRDKALEKYAHDLPYLLRGVKPPPMLDAPEGACTVGKMVDRLLEFKQSQAKSGEISGRTVKDLERTGGILKRELGETLAVETITPEDFTRLREKLSEGRGLVALRNEISRMRQFFNYAFEEGLIDKAIRFGQAFAKPGKKAIRRESRSKAKRSFTVEELRTLYQAADKTMKAFMLLALNGGMGNSDIGQLKFEHLTEDGWVDFPRPKTEVDREFPLWPETIQAIEAAKNDRGRLPHVFVTKYGQPWHKEGESASPISAEFRKLLVRCGLHKEGRGFYALRHVHRTLADGSRDQVACNYIMGHCDDSMAGIYREGIEPERLQAVVDHVRSKLAPIFEEVA